MNPYEFKTSGNDYYNPIYLCIEIIKGQQEVINGQAKQIADLLFGKEK